MMTYFFIRAETNQGPLNFAACGEIGSAVRTEQKTRGIQIFAYRVEFISESEYDRLTN